MSQKCVFEVNKIMNYVAQINVTIKILIILCHMIIRLDTHICMKLYIHTNRYIIINIYLMSHKYLLCVDCRHMNV